MTQPGAQNRENASKSCDAFRDGPDVGTVPRVWVLTGFRAGDKAQMLALAEALGWPFTVKQFAYRSFELVTNILLGPNLAGLKRDKSDHLTPPWPDLVISAGRRNEPIARWIKARSGGRTRLVHLGRPWAEPRHFDLVITTPQYHVPPRDNVLSITAPLHQVTAARLEVAAERWRNSVASLPQPRIAVLVGGSSPPYVFDRDMASRLGRAASAMARQAGGSLLVSTSPRTGPAATQALHAGIDVPCHFYAWQADPETNPYLGFLALADAFIVTGDSMSMVAEACATAKPVYLFDMGKGWSRMRSEPPARPELIPLADRLRPRRVLHWLIAHCLPRRVRRDIRLILRGLVANRQAAWLEEESGGDRQSQPLRPSASTDLPRAVARVRALFATPAGD
ncbi:mitochondrial fission ELM1 family protein [Dongia soli]|uniref:Mitochondrial fission ELM1 family protein n=1 Tax=Dongia soli TaxID=600628 RepID=A0ABU5E7C6_9PROT|nr:mitochondrial fission ELM1 family protein [Dongia soli]MDY0882086.1 mitochondrial fission ELM1 family protein [Dongia soli]